jgi:hypothetical protein
MGLFGFGKKEPKTIYLQVREGFKDEEEYQKPIVRMDEEVISLIDSLENYVNTSDPIGCFVRISNRHPTVKDPKDGMYSIKQIDAECIPLEYRDKGLDRKISFEKIDKIKEIKDSRSRIQFLNLKTGYDGVGIIRINKLGRLNGLIALNSVVEVEHIQPANAEKIVVQILDNKHNTLREEFIRSELFGYVVFKDQLTRIFFGDEVIPLKIIGVSQQKRPNSAMIVNEFTHVSISPC